VNVFNSLLKLYKGNDLKTPIEDFTTEILTNIFANYKELTTSFVNSVLKVPGTGFDVGSQECFTFKKSGRSFVKVDIVFRNDDSICFLENKVSSKEGHNQLANYGDVLSELVNYKHKYLTYCTKYHEDKTHILDHNFFQLRWCNVADFLKNYQEIGYIKDFLEFLEIHQMGNSTEFTIEELLSLKHFNPAVLKMNAYLDKIAPRFIENFGTLKSLKSGSELMKNSRVVIIKDGLFGQNYTEVGCGFDFKKAPKMQVWIWAPHNPEVQILTNLKIREEIYNKGGYLEITSPLSDFLGYEKMELHIELWFLEAFSRLKTILKENNVMCNTLI
jgi:hypothetical protein